jgi:hypothetical protein
VTIDKFTKWIEVKPTLDALKKRLHDALKKRLHDAAGFKLCKQQGKAG